MKPVEWKRVYPMATRMIDAVEPEVREAASREEWTRLSMAAAAAALAFTKLAMGAAR